MREPRRPFDHHPKINFNTHFDQPCLQESRRDQHPDAWNRPVIDCIDGIREELRRQRVGKEGGQELSKVSSLDRNQSEARLDLLYLAGTSARYFRIPGARNCNK